MIGETKLRPPRPFEVSLSSGPLDVRPLRLRIRDQVNAPYLARVDLAVPRADAADLARTAEGERAAVWIFDSGATRCVHGVVVGTRIRPAHGEHDARLSLRIAPRIDLLRHDKRARIFQQKTTTQIVTSILDEIGARHEVRVESELEERVYVCQYHETTFSFLHRVLAEDGLFYWFEHTAESEVMVIADSPRACRPIDAPTALLFRPVPRGGALESDDRHVDSIDFSRRLAPSTAVRRAFDMRKPPVESVDHSGPGKPSPGRAGPRLVHEVHLGTREEQRVIGRSASRHLEALRADAATMAGTSRCPRLSVGKTFTLEGHELDAPSELLITSVEHVTIATSDADAPVVTYQNRFVVTHADVAPRPPTPALKPRAALETATVVGPPGQDIHTDELGRVRVRFHWDSESPLDERASCWLRVQHPFAGASFGAQFIPRVDTEVLVAFVGGDPDRPIVTGSLYNGTSPSPFSLPADKEKVGFRTRSSGPGGAGGSHELVFDDTAGRETVSLRSQNALRVSSAGPSLTEVGADATTRVGGAYDGRVDGAFASSIGAGLKSTIAGEASTKVEGPLRAAFGSTAELTIEGSIEQRFGANVLTLIEGGRSTLIGSNPRSPTFDQTSVHGSSGMHASKEISLEAGSALSFRCGKSLIRMLPDSIVIDSPNIQLQAAKCISAFQGEETQESAWVLAGSFHASGGEIGLSSGQGATLVLDADAKLDGALVKLNCGASTGASVKRIGSADDKGQIGFRVLRDGLPAGVAEVTLVIAGPGGEVIERTCAVGGVVMLEGRTGETYAVVEMRAHGEPIAYQRVRSDEDEGENLDG